MRSLSRRSFLSGLPSLALSATAHAGGACLDVDHSLGATRSSIPLGEASSGVLWGTAIGESGLRDRGYTTLIAAERPRFLAIANALKFDHRQPREMSASDLARQNWKECDETVALASRLRVPIRGDCLAWNDWLPDWVKTLARDRPRGWRETLQAHFDDHIRAVLAHFDDLQRASGEQPMRWCGVVNEPLDPWSPRDGLAVWRAGAWLDAFDPAADGTPGYIHRAFLLAERHRAAGTTLFLNETFCESDRFGPLLRPMVLRLLDSLQHAGRSVGAVGLECHLMPQWMSDPRKPDWGPCVAFLRELSKRGVDIYLTELDVNDCSVRDTAERDRLVASTMQSFVTAALEVPAVTMVTSWDLSDSQSWWRDDSVYPSLSKWAGCVREPPCPRPTPYDAALQPKRARNALEQALSTRR